MDPFVSCPYNPEHRVPRSRIQQHLVKCEKNYPKLQICPYNATHRYPDELIKRHIADCPSREPFLLEDRPPQTTAILTTPKPMAQKEYLPKSDPDYECWDD